MKAFRILLITVGFFAITLGVAARGADRDIDKEKTDTAVEKTTETAAPEAVDAKSEAKADAKTGEGSFTCTNGSDVRKVTIQAGAAGGCEVMYDRGGESKAIAQANNETSVCDKAAAKVKANLTQSGFTCE